MCRGFEEPRLPVRPQFLDKIFELCVSANLALHLLINLVYVLAGESPLFTAEVS